MPSLTALDLVTTPVPVLNRTGLATTVGISGDDPLGERNPDERFGVVVSIYADGKLHDRVSAGEVGPGQRRLLAVGEMARDRVGDIDTLTVVHRLPRSIVPPDGDMGLAVEPSLLRRFEMYRTMVQLSAPGTGSGGVIYETPPFLNDLRSKPRPSTALMFSSKVWVDPAVSATTLLVSLNHSIDPGWRTPLPLRVFLFDAVGQVVAAVERTVSPFSVDVLDLGEIAARTSTSGNLTAVGWCREGALVFLFVQRAPGQVAIEHSHPPQAYLLAKDEATRQAMKSAAIDVWNARFDSYLVGA